jgi:phenylacetate-CoA ligase
VTLAQPPGEASLDLSVVVPCYNEEVNVPELTQRILVALDAGRVNGELVLVDDGSADATKQVISEEARKHGPRVVGLFHVNNRGIAAAWRSGVEAAHGSHVALIDADLQYQPEDILKLYRTLLESGVDVAQGWRSSVGRLRDGRYVMSRGLNTILNRGFGMRLRDNKSGFVCCAKEVMLDLLRYEGRYSYWQSFIMVAAHAKGYSYREIETLFEDRRQGRSFLDGQAYRAAFKNFIDVGRAFWEYRVRATPHDANRSFLERRGVIITPTPTSRSLRIRGELTALEGELAPRIRNAECVYETLQATQWLPADQIRELQDEKLRRLVRHAFRTVPYYRARMQALHVRPEDIRGQGDLYKLPILRKDDIRKHLYFDILKEGVSHAGLVRVSTSGRNGEPLVAYADRLQLEFRWAARARARAWAGHRLGEAYLELCAQASQFAGSSRLKKRLDAWASGRTRVPAWDMRHEGWPGSVSDLLRREGSRLIVANAEVLSFLARRLAQQAAPTIPSLRGAISSAQTLSANDRESIQGALGCPLFDHYTSREFSLIAAESEAHDGYLVVAEGYVVEVLVDGRPAQPGEVGEVVITDLNAYSMPFIRYRLGDLARAAAPAKAGGGRGLPRLGEILGRAQSVVQGEDGHYYPGTFFADLLSEYHFAIRRFRVAQREPGIIVLHFVKGSRYSDDIRERIVADIRRHLSSHLRVEFVLESQDSAPARELSTPGAQVSVTGRDALC